MPRWLWVAGLAVWLSGCAGTPERGRTDRYGLDSATATCRQTPALCARVAGEETVVPVSRAVQVSASVGTAGSVVLRVLTEVERDLIEQALVECAEAARSEVILAILDGVPPTEEKCREEAERDKKNQPVSWARKLGTEMHKVARECAQRKLSELRPGGFSLEPRYRYDPDTEKWEFIDEKEVRSLLEQGRGGELKGSIAPDVVIHTGDPNRVFAIYDFKFPCVNTDERAPWRRYPPDPPYNGRNQQRLYQDALRPTHRPASIQPRIGVVR
ncbi:hypothetical protein HPC49_06130 [Pyxidicoccus fallax]|uniref:Lipoprotein n=1 Tax=Pyxidicoccus fallax TaxID=394095 RepID=A0A848LG95_9BACT|nr:hypothetical protein [Pyxidicoccus fallax]NMO14868.1 hypothetical protein [Pyxidicoccus fallax]NPC77831.1 hypothetical protein [Pyxidicoccus fallax]